jgi:hypothetical protein
MIKYTYSGLSNLPEIKELKKRLKMIEATLTGRGCYNFQLSINYYYAAGFFTSPSGKVYYLSLPDIRFERLDEPALIREAANYKDYSGGINRYCKINQEALNNFFLS